MAITIAATVEPASGSVPPRVRLDITASAGETSTTVTRQDPDGRVYPVRTATGDPLTVSAGSGLLYDYEAPFGQQVWYSSLESPTNFVQATVTEQSVWLIHPGVPTLSRPIELAKGSVAEEEWPVQQGIYWPMGRTTPVVHTDGTRKTASSTLSVMTETPAQTQAIKALLADSAPLLLNASPALGLGLDTVYIAAGTATLRRPSDVGTDALRTITFPYTVVARPAGGSQALRTYTDLLIDFSSYADVYANYSTYLSVLSGS